MIEKIATLKNKRGFSLVEVAISTVILLTTIAVLTRFFSSLLREIDSNRERLVMSAVALSRLEEWRSHPYKDLVPDMPFRYFRRTIDRNANQVVFNIATLNKIASVPKINLTIDNRICEAGYSYNFTLPSGLNMLGGEDFGNDVWYDGPDATPGNNTPGVIRCRLTCPPGVSGILTIIVLDYNNKHREEKIFVNGLVIKKFTEGSFDTGVSLANRTVTYTLTQEQTKTGVVNIEIRQTGESNPPWNGHQNPNAVVSQIKFDILEGFTEHESYDPYIIQSQIIPTYNNPELVPGWQIMVTVSKEGFKPIFLATTIAQ